MVVTRHFEERMMQRNISGDEVIRTLEKPDFTYESSHSGNKMVHQRGSISIVIDERSKTLITVWKNI